MPCRPANTIDASEAKQWKRNVLEAYLGVTLKRLFFTGPEAIRGNSAAAYRTVLTNRGAAQPDSRSHGQDGVKR